MFSTDNKKWRTSAGLLAAAVVFALFPVLTSGGARAATAWYDAHWQYRRAVTINNGNASPFTDYQTQVTLNASNFDFPEAKGDGADLRFTAADGTTLLNYWIESYDPVARTASVWVRIPNLPKSSTTTVFLYYGNAGAASASSGDNTFMFYDGFSTSGTPNHVDTFSRTQVVLPPGPSGSWDERVRERMSVVYDSASRQYKAWYCGHTVAGGEASSDIGYATSPDGVNWTKYAGNPVVSRPQQDQDPCVIKVGNTFWMYIEVTPGYPNLYTDLFTSTDGINWTANPSNPVKANAATPLAWVEGSNWYMLYEDYASSAQQNINLATSADGVTWTDSPSNPVIQAEAGLDVCPDSIIKQNGTYNLYYHGNSLPRNLYSTSTDLLTWTAGLTLFPRYYESFWVIPHGNEFWAYAWNVSAYGNAANGGVENSGYHLFKGFSSTGDLNAAKWDEVQKGRTTWIDFYGSGVALPPYEDDATISSVSLESKPTFTNNIVVEVRRRLIGSSYADVSLGSGPVASAEDGGQADWWHTALQSGYVWYFNHIDDPTSGLRKMPASGGSTVLGASFTPSAAIQTSYEVDQMAYSSTGGLSWYVDGELKAQASDTDFLNTPKHLMISQGQYSDDQFSGEQDVQWIMVRKYAAVVPTSAVGARQTAPKPSTFYFAEGYTGPDFQEYLCVGNPSAAAASAQVEYIFADGTTLQATYAVPGRSRITVNVNQVVGPNREVSMKVTSPTPNIVAERPMYFNYHGQWTGGHDVIGAAAPLRTWYFAEGTTIDDFDEWITVLNPASTDAHLNFRYLVQGAGEHDVSATVPPHRRGTFSAAGQIGRGLNAGLVLESDTALVAERPMYFNYQGLNANNWTGGSDVVGAGAPGRQWLFAEGTTRPGFEEWLTLMNPGSTPMTVTVAYLLTAGSGKVVRAYDVPPRQRVTVSVNGVLGPGQDTAMSLSSDMPFVAERPLYFDYQGVWTGGDSAVGASAAAATWLFAEGYTGSDFNEWLTVLNPGTGTAAMTVTYLQQSGVPVTREHSIAGGSRFTINVNQDAGPGLSVSAEVQSDAAVVVERPMYFNYEGWTGGHDVVGLVPSP